MAGHRRETGRPLQRHTKYENRRARLDERLATASTPAEQIGAVSDFLRSVVTSLPEDIAWETARRAVDELIALAEDAHKQNTRRRTAA